MNAMVRDLKAVGQEVSEEEQVLNVIKALPNENEHWKSFKVIMTHSEHIKTFEKISKHLEMEKERIKTYAPPGVAFVAKGSGLGGRKPYHDKKPKKGPHPPQNSHSNNGTAKKHKAKGNGVKDMACVKCYNYVKKGHFARDCPELAKAPLPTKTSKLYVCSHAFIANSLPKWIVNTGAIKHIVQDKAGFMKFNRYPMGSRTVILGNDSKEDVLRVGTYQLKLHGGNKLLLYDTLYALVYEAP